MTSLRPLTMLLALLVCLPVGGLTADRVSAAECLPALGDWSVECLSGERASARFTEADGGRATLALESQVEGFRSDNSPMSAPFLHSQRMVHRFVTQPIAGGYDLQDFIEEVCADPAIERLDLVVAWVKRGGLLGIRDSIEQLRRRRALVRGVVGISLGGTSRQGLVLARAMCDELYVFHEPGRTFHPKVYLASGQGRARALVGSNNLTFGGLSRNYEAAVKSDLDLTDETDRAYYESLRDFIDGLVSEVELCPEATPLFLERLFASSRYPILDENASRESDEDVVEGARASEGPADEHGDDERLFGARRRPMRPERPTGPAGTGGAPTGRLPRGRAARGTSPVPTSSASDVAVSPAIRRWYKRLEAADAQQLRSSSPSNTMTLVMGGHDIDASTYFREEFFGDETWAGAVTRGRGQPREVASIDCEVVVDGTALGVYRFEVRHTPGYDSDRGNRTTELVWNDFGAYLRANPLNGRTATLEKLRTGRYRVSFERAATGPFLR